MKESGVFFVVSVYDKTYQKPRLSLNFYDPDKAARCAKQLRRKGYDALFYRYGNTVFNDVDAAVADADRFFED